MEPVIGVEYNIRPIAVSAREHPNPIFRGIIETKRKDGRYNIKVTEYNITNKYKPQGVISGIDGDRFTSIVKRDNKSSKHVLKLFKEEE